MTICIAEDRTSCEPAIRLLIASLSEHCPGLTIELFAPNGSDELLSWLSDYPAVHLNSGRIAEGVLKYDIKPRALLTLLGRGLDEVIWIDSDILICADFRPLFIGLGSDVVVVTEEALCSGHGDPEALRARLWGMAVGRELPFTANTAVIRVTKRHLDLLLRWEELLMSPVYREAQAGEWQQRPLHLMGDQEVLTALLASKDFCTIPIKFLRRGANIIQYFGMSGYTIRERLLNIFGGMPPFIHSQGFRPWWIREAPALTLRDKWRVLYEELSPYTLAAQKYRNSQYSSIWMNSKSASVAFFRILAFGQPALIGMPLAFIADLVRILKRFDFRVVY